MKTTLLLMTAILGVIAIITILIVIVSLMLYPHSEYEQELDDFEQEEFVKKLNQKKV
jgi:amino acid permease